MLAWATPHGEEERGNAELLDRYASSAKALVAAAQAAADERKHAEVQPIHFLYRALEREPSVREVFRRAGSTRSSSSLPSIAG